MSRVRIVGWGGYIHGKGKAGNKRELLLQKKPFAKTKPGDGGGGGFYFPPPPPALRPQLICNRGGPTQCNRCGKSAVVEQCCAKPYVCCSSSAC